MAYPRRIPETTPGKTDSVVNIDMQTSNMRLFRISKLLVDRVEMTAEEALTQRGLYRITLQCGPEVVRSRTLQLAILTAANIAKRCFPGAVRIALETSLAETSLLLWPSLEYTFGQALVGLLGPEVLIDSTRVEHEGRTLIFGDGFATRGALRVTFDGWIAKVGPAATTNVLPQREYCSLSGVLAGALAISELFLSFADLNIGQVVAPSGSLFGAPSLISTIRRRSVCRLNSYRENIGRWASDIWATLICGQSLHFRTWIQDQLKYFSPISTGSNRKTSRPVSSSTSRMKGCIRRGCAASGWKIVGFGPG